MSTTNLTPSRRPAESFVDEARTAAVMTEAMSSRSVQEVQAALVVAKRFPRDEFNALTKIKTACQRQGLAEIAEYEYSRGGTKITGPTIDLLKAIAKRWGNIEYGWQELERERGKSTVRAFAWDMESNARSEMTFTVRHWRDKSGGAGYELTDERDIYELTANFAARRVRACLESVIDGDIVDEAVNECRKTLAGKNNAPLVDQVRQMVSAFTEFGVTQEMIEKRLGNKLDAVSHNQLAGLRRIYKSLKDGVGTREEFFKGEGLVATENGNPPARSDDDDGDLAPQKAKATSTKAAAEAEPLKEAKAAKEQPAKPAGEKLGTVQDTLAEIVTGAGFTYDDFVRWAMNTGNMETASEFPGFAEIPTEFARRFSRNKVGLLQGLERQKGVGA